ncbi:MAG TPA: UDP-3-O-(3-hydroxymyristoyl)glucosamine N-acyltransferase [Bryobacteraceae bacterium]|nr:UDP-3-O-(3-hydroxymyristoyl)glucosamine N-acyltransferase [Bryobacteraceae bacterium]
MLVRELAQAVGATFEGDGEKQISGVAAVESAGAADLSFAAGPRASAQTSTSSAGCLIVPHEFENTSMRTVIRSANPRATFAQAVSRLLPPPAVRPGIHPTAIVAGSARVDPTAEIGPHVSVGERSSIGAGTSVGAGAAIGNDVSIGDHCRLYPMVTLYDSVNVGHRAILHSGCVLGADGFGFVLTGDHYEKFPQVGRVSIGNDVEIGANSCIDRAALGVTAIGDGTKLDNMVHVGHNCRIGRHVVIAAQTGLSGGVVIEDYAVIGGQVGIGDKARVESRAVLGSGSGVLTSKIVRGGQVLWGVPARPLKEHLEQLANLGRLPELRRDIEKLRSRLAALEAAYTGSNPV